MKIIIKNIGILAGIEFENNLRPRLSGAEMSNVEQLNDAWLAIEDGRISSFGTMEDWPGISDWRNLDVIDAAEGAVIPAWCDSHTHIVFAAPREKEFVMRIEGSSYEEIAAAGGGILNSAKRLQETPQEELFESALKRLNEIISMGTGAVEIKSGYGLSLEDELKMLRVIQQLKSVSPITIKSTFLGAHAIPATYKNSRQEYIELIINQMIPAVAEEGLGDYCDVFCDRGFFTPEETDKILAQGLKYGLKPKIHANELDFSGGIQMGVKHNAISVDHLECTGDEEIELLKTSHTMPTLLPGTAFFLGLHYPPARKMIDSGLPIALASDYNPGSCPSGNMWFVQSLACTQMKMLPSEAFNAATLNGAAAMELEHSHGNIAAGKVANLIITDKITSLDYLPYAFGKPPVQQVIINGTRI
jgi:imidazolonepropionase